MVGRLQNNKAFTNIVLETVNDCDQVTFDVDYTSLMEMGRIHKTLRLRRLPEKDSEGDPLPNALAGKVIATEKHICPTCKHESWKNVGKELRIHILGGYVPGW